MNGRIVGEPAELHRGGPNESCLNLVIVGDGYLPSQMREYRKKCDELLRVIESEAWFRAPGNLNVFRIDVESSGTTAWLRRACPGKPVKSYFQTRFCANKSDPRYLGGDGELARQVAADHVPEFTAVLVLANVSMLGGGTSIKACWTHTGSSWTRTALHELGHALFDLGDEYGGRHEKWSFPEPRYENATVETDPGKIEWRHLIKQWTPIPTPATSANQDIGLFEGALGYDRGVYRGALRCKMRQTQLPFCAVCLDIIERKFKAARGAQEPESPVIAVPDPAVLPHEHVSVGIMWVDGVPHVELFQGGENWAGSLKQRVKAAEESSD